MRWRPNSIRFQLQGGFFFLAFNIIVLSIISYYYFSANQKLHRFKDEVNRLHITYLNLRNFDQKYFSPEVTYNYLKKQGSLLLKKRDSLQYDLRSSIFSMQENAHFNAVDLFDETQLIDSTFQEYNLTMKDLIQSVQERGANASGMIGEIRIYSQALEKYPEEFSPNWLLHLKRYEKDFLLEHDSLKAVAFNRYIEDSISSHLNGQNPKIAWLLHAYQHKFNELVILDRDLGLLHSAGLLQKKQQLNRLLGQELTVLANIDDVYLENLARKNEFVFAFTLLLTVSLSIFLSIRIQKKIGLPIKKLSQSMEDFSVSKHYYKVKNELGNQHELSEIRQLYSSFLRLIKKIKQPFLEMQKREHHFSQENEELKKLNKELDRFVYSSAHDLRSPLSSLRGLIQLAHKESKDEKMLEYFEMMQQSITKLDSFIKEIVDFSKAKQSEVKVEEIHLRHFLEQIINDHRFSIELPLQLDMKIPSDLVIYSDIYRLSVIFSNLIGNAFKYHDPGKEQFVLTLDASVNDQVEITVSDNGMGIDAAYIDKIFDMFYRATVSGKGSGLGLFIVKETVVKLGGDIKVTSKKGEGTTFVLTFPHQLPSTDGEEAS